MSESQFDKLKQWAGDAGIPPNGPAPPADSTAPVPPAPNTPRSWFAAKFPDLEKRFGAAVEEVYPDEESGRRPYVKDLSEDFLAATLGEHGAPDAPTVFAASEARFYTYSPTEGIFAEAREAKLTANLSELLLACARDCASQFDTSNLEFKFRDSANLRGVITRARGLLEVGPDYFQTGLMEFVPCKNGMLRISDRALLEFSPKYRRRNKLAVDYVAGAQCPLFVGTLLRQALEEPEIDLFQRWGGLALVGMNMAQRLVILMGTAGGGKGTLIRVVNGIIGAVNVGSLRADLLDDHFELGRLYDKTLLYGADVPDNFLNCKGASVLKALTGGDPVTLEFKGSNERPQIICRFNAIVTCNSRLTVRLEGDAAAWRRRLVIIEFRMPKPENVIADLSERILAEEGPGVLNWMLDGLDKIRAAAWQLILTDAQQRLVDDLLLESEGDVVFAKECLEKDALESLTVADCYDRYVSFCNERGWAAMAKRKFSNSIGDTVTRLFGITVRHDVADWQTGKPQRGWKGIKCK